MDPEIETPLPEDAPISNEELEELALTSAPIGSQGEGEELCVNCLKEVGRGQKFCHHCQAPIHSLAAFAFDGTLAQGFIYRRAIGEPSSRFVLFSVWFIFLPSALMLGYWIFFNSPTHNGMNWLLTLVEFLASVAAVYQVTKNYRARHKAGESELG